MNKITKIDTGTRLEDYRNQAKSLRRTLKNNSIFAQEFESFLQKELKVLEKKMAELEKKK